MRPISASLYASLCTSLLAVGCQTPLPSDRGASAPSPKSPVGAKPTGVTAGAKAKAKAEDSPPPDSEIVTAEVLKMNTGAPPPKTFRSGHVVKRAAPPPKLTAAGFEVKFGAAMITTPTVYENKVIVSGGFNSKELYAFEAKTGKPVWGLSLDDDGPSNPACEQGVCVINTESCTIFAVAADTGQQLWSWWLGDPLTSSPTIANGRVFTSFPAATADDGKPRPDGATHVLAAFDLHKGAMQWELWLDSDVMSAPVAVGEFVYVTTFAGTVIKLEQATGKVRYAMKAQATSAPVVQFQAGVESMYYTRRGEKEKDGAEEMIIRADHNEPKTRYKAAQKKATYIDPKVQGQSAYSNAAKSADSGNGFSGGAPASAAADKAVSNVGVGSVSSMQGFQGSRVLQMGTRNVNTMGDEVIATDADSGNVLWKQKLSGDQAQGGFFGTAPVPAGNTVLYATLAGEVQRLDAGNGKLLASYKVGGRVRSQPVIAGGWIYIGTEDGKLVAINTNDPAVDGWPTWGGNAQRTGVSPQLAR
jgi:outer membrane protein assembly factor BamB